MRRFPGPLAVLSSCVQLAFVPAPVFGPLLAAPVQERAGLSSDSKKEALSAAASDAAIRAALTTRLVEDGNFDPGQLRIAVSEGRVLLRGVVDDLILEDFAVRLAETVRGVRSVSPDLRLSTPDRPASEVLADVGSALALAPGTRKLALRLRMDESTGAVEISGNVASWAEGQRAISVIKGVPGMRRIRSKLTLSVPRARGDLELVREVIQRFHRDPWLEQEVIRVRSEQGRLRLSGVVSNALARRRAFETAWVPGVGEVDFSGIQVIPGRRSGPGPVPEPKSPSQTEAAFFLKQELARDPLLDGAGEALSVRMEDRVATLEGQVPTLAARVAAEEDAWNTLGVASVRNRVTVKSAGRLDPELSEDVRTALRVGVPASLRDRIGFSVRSGTVILTGRVRTPAGKWRVLDAIARIPGVLAITDRIEAEVARADDAEIRRRILTGIASDPLLEPGRDRVEVAVSGGMASLSGQVAGWSGHLAATREALRAGATRVESSIGVARARTESPRRFSYETSLLAVLQPNIRS